MCFLAERDIPVSLLPPADDELEADETIGTLEGYGFTTKREDGASMDMHRLVRLATRNWLVKAGQAQLTYFEVLWRVAKGFPFPEHENRGIWIKYMAHAQRVLEHEEECDDKAMRELLFNVAEALSIQGRYREAANMYRQAAELSEKVLGKEHPDTLGSMNNLALVLHHMGEDGEAAKIHRRTLELSETVLCKEHPSTLGSMNNLTNVLQNTGKYGEAEGVQRQTEDT